MYVRFLEQHVTTFATKWKVAFCLLFSISCSSNHPKTVEENRDGPPNPPVVDPEITVAELVAPFIEDKWIVGLSVGVFQNGEEHYFNFGTIKNDEETQPTEKTVYEIGSISKVFTALLLATLVEEGEVSLSVPVETLYPDFPVAFEGKPITLKHLSNHTSGLPRLPDNMDSAVVADPYADYSDEDLAEFLKSFSLEKLPGTAFTYSNLAMGLLGVVLTHIELSDSTETTFEARLVEKVITPLGLVDTKIESTPDQVARQAFGHNVDAQQVPFWNFKSMAGAGAVRSTARDMLLFAKAQFTPPSALAAAIALTHAETFRISEERGIGLGWILEKNGGLFHNGQTGGFSSFLFSDRSSKTAVVLLANTATSRLDSLGLAILKRLEGDAEATITLPHTIELTGEALEKFVGTYKVPDEIAPDMLVHIAQTPHGLTAGLTGQSAFRIYPSSPTDFYYRIVDAKIVFQFSESIVTGLTLHNGGEELTAVKLN